MEIFFKNNEIFAITSDPDSKSTSDPDSVYKSFVSYNFFNVKTFYAL